MDADFENLLRETENRRRIAMQEFFSKYATHTGDSDDEVFDFKANRIIEKKKKRKNLNKAKTSKRKPPKSIKFGQMNSYCISVESKKYIRRITNHIITTKQSDADDSVISFVTEECEETETTKVTVTKNGIDDSLCNENQDETLSLNCKSNQSCSLTDSVLDCETEKYKEADTSKIIVKQNRINDAYNDKKSDFSEDEKSIYNDNQNETLPLISKSKVNCALKSLHSPNNSKLDYLVYDQSKISKIGERCFSENRQTYAYKQYFTRNPNLDAFRKGLRICPLASDSEFEYSKTKYAISSFSSSTPVLTGSKRKKCSFQGIMLSKNAIAGSFKSPESYRDFKSSQNVSNSSLLKSKKSSLSVNPEDDCVQKLSQKNPNCKKMLLESFTPVSLPKRLRPRCPNSGLVTLNAPQKECTLVCSKEYELQRTCDTIVLRNSNTRKSKNVLLLEESSTESASYDAVNPNTRTSHNFSTDKSIKQGSLKFNLTMLKDKCTAEVDVKNKYTVQMDKKNKCAGFGSSSSSLSAKDSFNNDISIFMFKNGIGNNINKFQSLSHSASTEVSNTVSSNNIHTLQQDGFSSPHTNLSISNEKTQHSTDKQLIPNNGSASSQVFNMKNKSEEISSKSVSTKKSSAENLQYNSVKLCNEVSGKLSTVTSNNKNHCPKINSPVATSHSLRSEAYYSNSTHASVEDYSGGKYPILRGRSAISYSKDTFKISSNEPLINRNPPMKNTSFPEIGKKHFRCNEASTPNACSVSAIGDNSSTKGIFTPQTIKERLRPRKIPTPKTCPNLYMESRLSHSVEKSNLKYARNAFYKFHNSPYYNKNGSTQNLSSDNHDILGIKLASSVHHSKYELRDTPRKVAKKRESMKPLPKKLKLTPNVPVDSLSML